MLIDIPYKKGDVVSLKLTSGEELVGKVIEESDDSISLSKPMMIAATQQGLGLAPFMFSISNDAKVVLNISSILCVIKTEKEFAAQYTENTTGIAI